MGKYFFLFLYFAKTAPAYISEMYNHVEQLKLSNQTTICGLKTLSYIDPKLWNAFQTSILSVNTINNFKHNVKENFFKELQKTEDSPYIHY